MSLTFNISLNVSHVSAICVDLIEHCQVGKMTENITIVGGYWGCLVLMALMTILQPGNAIYIIVQRQQISV